jgi:hypothetical protein
MTSEKKEKNFLDTSIFRPYLQCSYTYKQYLKDYFGGNPLYITKYVKMEYYRGYLRSLLDFYFHLSMDSIKTFGDALFIWNHQFQSRKQKAIGEFVANLFNTHELNIKDLNDKPKALMILAAYIKRLSILLKRKFKDIGKDETKCSRATITLDGIGINDNIVERFYEFIQLFDDVIKCRTQCTIDKFFLTKYKSEANYYVEYLNKIDAPNREDNIGFVKIVSVLAKAMANNKFSCHICKIIGDAVIALGAPRDMRLEHTDHSFDHLCNIINQPHFKHPHETAVVRKGPPQALSTTMS